MCSCCSNRCALVDISICNKLACYTLKTANSSGCLWYIFSWNQWLYLYAAGELFICWQVLRQPSHLRLIVCFRRSSRQKNDEYEYRIYMYHLGAKTLILVSEMTFSRVPYHMFPRSSHQLRYTGGRRHFTQSMCVEIATYINKCSAMREYIQLTNSYIHMIWNAGISSAS